MENFPVDRFSGDLHACFLLYSRDDALMLSYPQVQILIKSEPPSFLSGHHDALSQCVQPSQVAAKGR